MYDLEDLKIIKLLKGFLQRIANKEPAKAKRQPIIIPRSEHSISREAISHNALKVLYRLHNAGYSAYLVGGCVRDLLFGRKPKDFDIATSARPEEIRQLFKNCRLIGKRFRLAHIVFGKEIIEVATFRTHHENAQELHGKSRHGMIIRDNVFGDIEDDVWRRDFTINSLYYNIADFSVVDYTGGMHDIQTRTLRIIGKPELRFQEDPVRLLRAVRFLGKLNLNTEADTERSLMQMSHLLQNVSAARLFQEVLKLFHEGATANTFKLMQQYHLFEQLFPQTSSALAQPETKHLLEAAFISTDRRTEEGKTVSPAFLLAVLLWRPVLSHVLQAKNQGLPPYVALEKALQHVLKAQTQQLAAPRQIMVTVREIFMLQHQFNQRHGSRPFRVLEHPRFRAGYDLLLLRAEAGEPVQDLAEWWTQFYSGDHAERERLVKEAGKTSPRGKKPRRKKKAKSTTQTTQS